MTKIKQTCTGNLQYSTCVLYQKELPQFSKLEDCVTLEETTEELYKVVQEIKDQDDLSELGESCLDYVQVEGKVFVKNALLKLEEEICAQKAEIANLKNRQLCDMLLGDCVDTSNLVDTCGNPILTLGQLLQILINN